MEQTGATVQHVAVYPGSFDPITLGHVEVAQRASKLFGRVILAVAADAEKKHMFSVDERVDMARRACEDIGNITVDSFEGLVVDYARRCGAQTLIKGLRAVSDFELEMQMATMNRQLAPDLDTLYLMAMPQFTFLSSSLVKHVHKLGGNVSAFVHPFVLEMLDARNGR
ncbi:MAG: pantetheine-phosphate adenylyltransferase [Acidobacteriota bacterium]|nr:pantetheine-phosphate adenylyltransferase [Acidobacteriota bacterium]